jgi:hypothetical protein
MCWVTNLFTRKKSPPTLREYDDWVRAQIGKVPRQKMLWQDLVDMLAAHGLTAMLSHPPDYKIRFTNEETLAKMVPFLTYPADYYVAELEINCDDYARWAAADARRIFHIQGVYEAWGWITVPYETGERREYHAWSLGITGFDRFKIFENNAGFPFAGELFDVGQKYDYHPEKWK